MKKRILILACVCAFCAVFFAACSGGNVDEDKGGKIRIGAMSGPTMMGLGQLYHTMSGETDPKYTFTTEAAADTIIGGFANRTLDVACLPANNAAILFNNGELGIKVAAINTLNVLYVLQKAGTPDITALSDLAGKTVYMPGQGQTPEVAFRYLLAKNNISNVTLEFESAGSTIASGIKLADSKYDYAVLPQPAATSATMGEGKATEAFNLTAEWKKHNPDSDVVTGVLVVRTAFLKNNKAAFDQFLSDYKASIEFMTNAENLDTAAGYVVDMGIVPQLPVAKAALPKCGIAYIEKADMKTKLVDFYTILRDQDANSIGGKLPANDFYYV